MKIKDYFIYTDKGSTLAVYRDKLLDSFILEFDITLHKSLTYTELLELLEDMEGLIPSTYRTNATPFDKQTILKNPLFNLSVAGTNKYIEIRNDLSNPSELVITLIEDADGIYDEFSLEDLESEEVEMFYVTLKDFANLYNFLNSYAFSFVKA